MAQKDFFENINYRDGNTGKQIQNWMNVLKKKNKIVIPQFMVIFSKCSNINYPLEIKMLRDGYYKVYDVDNQVVFLKCYPYEGLKPEQYSIIKGKDEFLYGINTKGEINLKGIMEVEDEDEIAEPPKASAPMSIDHEAPMSEDAIDDFVAEKFDGADIELISKLIKTAIKSNSINEFFKNV